jgi:hypothetical protein
VEQSAYSGAKRIETSITVIRADGTRQEYGVVDDSSWGWRQRLVAALRTRRLNREARRANPSIPRTSLLALARHVFYGGN